MMTENLHEAISLDQAVERMMGETPADDETTEEQAEPETDEVEPETAETEVDADEDDEGEPDAEPSIEIDTADGKRKLTASQIAEHLMLKADYTRKTMAIAEERKTLEAVKAEASQLKTQLAEALQVWAVPTEQEPDWAQLATTKTPQEFNVLRARWEGQQKKAMQAREHFRQLREAQHQEIVQAEQERLFEAFPDWRDPEKYQGAAQRITKAGQDYGFTPAELGQIVDHRMIKVLNDAAAYRALQEGKPAVTKKVAQAPTTLKPGGKTTKEATDKAARQKQLERLKKTGSVDDALDLLFR